MNQVIVECINEAFINFNDQLDNDTVSYMSGLIQESESIDELREQIDIVIKDFALDFEQDRKPIEKLISLLKKKAAVDYSLVEERPKSHLVCEVDPEAEPSLDDPNLTMDGYLQLTRSKNPITRRMVLRTMCPCKVKADVDLLWARIMEMAHDEDPKVRYQVMHNLCDGSPLWREESVIQTLEGMHNDQDPKIRRRIHNILTHYKHTGKWNIM
ncbi:hypothetical protein SAMD00019534_085510, partial [Acytostelium subglobosum LB1]|uniref:hypothetical protein n=1 Tax=Acytostelium subglobosum LB1 TaxID=1410327 RepID=UPI000644B6D6